MIESKLIKISKQVCNICESITFNCDECDHMFEINEVIFCDDEKYDHHYCKECKEKRRKVMTEPLQLNFIKEEFEVFLNTIALKSHDLKPVINRFLDFNVKFKEPEIELVSGNIYKRYN